MSRAPAAPRKAPLKRTTRAVTDPAVSELENRLESISLDKTSTSQIRKKPAPSAVAKPPAKLSHDVKPSNKPALSVPDAMKTVNAVLNKLRNAKTAKPALANYDAACLECEQALASLRKQIDKADKRRIDVERAALSAVSALLDLALYEQALSFLISARSSILSLYPQENSGILSDITQGKPSSQPAQKGVMRYGHLLAYSQATNTGTDDSSLLPQADIASIVLHSIYYSISAIINLPVNDIIERSKRIQTIATSATNSGNLLHWTRMLASDATESNQQKVDAILQQTFSLLIKNLSKSDDASNPADMLTARTFALQCFIESSVIKDKQDMLWDQARKALVTFGRSAQKQGLSDTSICDQAFNLFCQLQTMLLKRNTDLQTQSSTFTSFCDLLLQVARKVNNVKVVQNVAAILQASANEDILVTPDLVRTRASTLLIEATQSLEQPVEESVSIILARLRKLPSIIAQTLELPADHKASTQVFRHLEAFRVVSWNLLRAQAEDSDLSQMMESTLDVLAKTVEMTIESSKVSNNDIALGALDTLINLAKRQQNLSKRRTAPQALSTMDRSLKLLHISSTPSLAFAVSADELKDTTRHNIECLAAAYYNLGGAWFNDGKQELAIPFLERACHIGNLLSTLPEGQQTQSQHLPRRWELLALAYQAISDRKKSFEAYIAAITSHPPSFFASLAVSAATLPISEVFAPCSNFSKMVQRLTRLGISDLLLSPSEVSLQTYFPNLTPSELGALLEFQLSVLDAAGIKPEVFELADTLLAQLLDLYSTGKFPLRRMRCIARQMERLLSSEASSDKFQESFEELNNLATSAPSEDEGLSKFKTQYLTAAHLLSAVDCYRCQHYANFNESVQTALDMLTAPAASPEPKSPKGSVPKVSQKKVSSNPITKSNAKSALTNNAKAASIEAKIRPSSKIVRRPVASSTTKTIPKSSTASAAKSSGSKLAKSTGQVAKSVSFNEIPKTPPRKSLSSSMLGSSPVKAVNLSSIPTKYDNVERFSAIISLVVSLLEAAGNAALRIAFLRVLRRISKATSDHTGFADHSTTLAFAYLSIGKVESAMDILKHINMDTVSSSSTTIDRTLCYSLAQLLRGHPEESANTYAKALKEADKNSPEAKSTSARIIQRARLLRTTARAASIYSQLQLNYGMINESIATCLQSLRLWHRALSNISRISSVSTKSDKSVIQDTTVNTGNDTFQQTESSAPKYKATFSVNAALFWEIASGVINQLVSLSNLHTHLGTARPAAHFLQQAKTIVQELHAPGLHADLCFHESKLQTMQGLLDDAIFTLQSSLQIDEAVQTLQRQIVQGEVSVRREEFGTAIEGYDEASDALIVLNRLHSDVDMRHATPRKSAAGPRLSESPRTKSMFESVHPDLQLQVIHMQSWLASVQGKIDEANTVHRQVARLMRTDSDRAIDNMYQAQIRLNDLQKRLSKDPLTDLLHESALSLPPAGSITNKTTSQSRNQLLNAISEIEALLLAALRGCYHTALVHQVRQICLALADLYVIEASLGRTSEKHAVETMHCIDTAATITLSRESLSTAKPTGEQDDLIWPQLTTFEPLQDITEGFTDASWTNELPYTWTVVSMAVSPKQDALFITQARRDLDPIVFRLPFDRLGKREGEDELLTFQSAKAEMAEIIAEANSTAQRAKDLVSKEERVAWWQERKGLDDRLVELLQNIQERWLGTFQSVMLKGPERSAESIIAFRIRLDRILKKSIIRALDSKASRVRLSDRIVDCFAELPPTCSDEALEDLIYFVSDAFQFCGIQVVCDEVDIEQTIVDIRNALAELHSRPLSPATRNDSHLILILDKHTQTFPWESIPALKGKSVSRCPSLPFLKERLAMMRAQDPSSEHFKLEKTKGFYLLNPSEDLKHSQSTFEEALSSESLGWSGVSGRIPMEEELRKALSEQDIFCYIGHGGAEQYIRSQTIRRLPRCAATFLWGCSSGLLRENGDFDLSGTPWNYMLAKSPMLVANLWDVTDKDIDRLTQSVFDKIGLIPHIQDTPAQQEEEVKNSTVPLALAQSRTTCILRALNGAAPVVWGVPCSIRQ